MSSASPSPSAEMQPKGGAKAQSAKTHRRSRTGCFTCRLRRKKCDEGKPLCRACKHLGLVCDYKRPCWWGNVEQRKRQKENIKMMIKRTKLTEKAVHLSPPSSSADSPPGLSRSLPTSDTLSDTMNRQRSHSVESGFSLDNGDMSVGVVDDAFHGHGHHPNFPHSMPPGPNYMRYQQPYPGPQYNEYDHQQQDENCQNGFNMRRPSSTSSFSSMRRTSMSVPMTTMDPSYVGGPTVGSLPQQQHHHHSGSISPDYSYLDFNNSNTTVQHDASATPYIPVAECDRGLMDHFLGTVQRLFFPILDLHGTARDAVIQPALENNECYRHCCLSIAALHLKTTQHLSDEHLELVDQDITRHRYATISGLCEALAKDTDHLQILEATIGMILFQCSVGSPDDSLPDIPWHQHFQAAVSLVNKLDLPRFLHPLSISPQLTPTLNMTLTAWIDILGATMQGRAPHFADTYREKHLSASPSGLRELMGCDDRVMYLISEIVCLENLRDQHLLTDSDLCEHVKSLAHQIEMTETHEPLAIPNAPIDPRSLTATITAAFRYASRIYLCSLVPGFDRNQPQVVQLLAKLTATLDLIPVTSDNYDRSLVWVYLIGGSVAGPDAGFRHLLEDRCRMMGDMATQGSWARMKRVLDEVWRLGGDRSWRDVMRVNGWESLLI